MLLPMLLGALMPLQRLAYCEDQPQPQAAYLLVLCHSKSMNTPAGGRSTRWGELQQRVSEFVQNCKLNSIITVAVYSDKVEETQEFTLLDASERELICDFVVDYPAPTKEGAALYDAWGKALEQAGRMWRDRGIHNVCVNVFADADDTHSKTWNKSSIESKTAELQKENSGLVIQMNRIPAPGGGILRFVDVDVSPTVLRLPSPKKAPKQTLTLALGIPELWQKELRRSCPKTAMAAALEFVPGSGTPSPLSPTKITGVCPLDTTGGEVTLDVGGDKLDAETEYQGTLRITYPKVSSLQFVGKREIPVLFQKSTFDVADADIVPRTGSVLPANFPVLFEVSTLRTAAVLWQFGEQTVEGARIRHSFDKAGDVDVTCTIDAGDLGKVTKKLTLKIEAITATVNRPAGLAFANRSTTLTCSGTGGAANFRWLIDGDEVPSVPGKPNECAFAFQSLGRHHVRVVGSSQQTSVLSKEISVDVLPKPAATIVIPPAGKTFTCGEKILFGAELAGPIRAVKWIFSAKGSATPLAAVEKPIMEEMNKRLSTIEYAFDKAWGVTEVEVTALPLTNDWINVETLPHKTSFRASADGRALRLLKPELDAALLFDHNVSFRADVVGEDVAKVAWTVEGPDKKVLLNKTTEVQKDGAQRRALLEHTFTEIAGGAEATVRLTGVLAEGATGTPPTDAQTLHFPPPVRAIRIVSPEMCEPLVFGQEIAFEAEIDGSNMDQVAWTIVPQVRADAANAIAQDPKPKAEDAKPLLGPTLVPVTTEGDRRVSRLKHTFAGVPGELDILAKVEAILPESLKAAGPVVEQRPYTVSYGELKAEIACAAAGSTDGSRIQWNTPALFAVSTEQDVGSVTWTFGDEREPVTVAGRNPVTHTFSSLGRQVVNAAVTGTAGKACKLVLNTDVVADELKAAAKPFPSVLYRGVPFNLEMQSTGPILSASWRLDGQPLPDHATSTTLSTTGSHTLELTVVGPVGPDGKPMTNRATFALVAVERFSWGLYAAIGAGVLLALGLAWYVLGRAKATGPQ
jgi:hypothetical protein